MKAVQLKTDFKFLDRKNKNNMISRLTLHTSISCSYDLYVKQDTTIKQYDLVLLESQYEKSVCRLEIIYNLQVVHYLSFVIGKKKFM